MAELEHENHLIETYNTIVDSDTSFLPFRPHIRSKDDEDPLYLKWRKALLFQKAKSGQWNDKQHDRRIDYMYNRELLLSTKFPLRNRSKIYGNNADVEYSSTRTATRSEYDGGSDFDERKLVSASDWYSFKGMHHIMAHHSKAVTRLKFSHDEHGVLAMSSLDGEISIVETMADNIDKTLKILKGHTMEITDIEFSKNSAFLVSCSFDKTIRVWDVKTGNCLRTFEETSPVTALMFHPINEHILICGNTKGTVKFISFSSGKEIASCQLNHPVTGITMDTDSASSLFIGDAVGNLHFVDVKLYGSDYVLEVKGFALLAKGQIASIHWRKRQTPRWAKPTLLISQCDAPIKIISISKEGSSYQAEEFCQFPRKTTKIPVRSCYSPLSYTRNIACITCGSDTGTIYIYSYRQSSNPKKKGRVSPINQLSGHASPVIDVQWNHDESLLASCDQDGMVILWKRVELINQTTMNSIRTPRKI